MADSDEFSAAFDYSYERSRALDPLGVYQERAKYLASKAAGVERYVYQLFGSKFIGSFAFAIDPLARFRVADMYKFANPRLREIRTPTRYNSWERFDRNRTRANYKLPGAMTDYGPLQGNWVTLQNSHGNASQQDQKFIPQYTIDTVQRSRSKGNVTGPFEKFKYSIHSPSFSLAKREYSTNSYPPLYGGTGQRAESDTRRRYKSWPYAAISIANQNTFLSALKVEAQSQMQKNTFGMLAKCVPTAPRFDLNRSILELKDFRSFAKDVVSLRTVDEILVYLKDLREFFYRLKKQPDLFLSLNFGLAPVVSDVVAICRLPEQVAKRINLLITRNGLATAYRTKRPCDAWSYTPPSFDFDYTGVMDAYRQSNSFQHVAELRMAVSATFEFPPVDLPTLNDDLVRHQFGLDPSWTTLYQLVPWTWLIDWFSGLGDYLNVMERLNSDPSLVNGGFITYSCEGSFASLQTSRFTNRKDIMERPGPNVTSLNVIDRVTTASMKYSFQKRVPVSSMGVKTTYEMSHLDSFQTTIIGSLLGQRLFRK